MIAHHYMTENLAVLALEVAPGRLDRIAVAPVEEYGKIKRLALAWNAVQGISEKSLEALMRGGSAGTLAERALAWSLFVASARPAARKYLERAQDAIKKQGEA